MGFPGNMGDPLASLGHNTGEDDRSNNIQVLRRRLPAVRSEREVASRYLGATSQTERWEKRGGSLSGFIVPTESRRTELREPGSREGSYRMSGCGRDTGPRLSAR